MLLLFPRLSYGDAGPVALNFRPQTSSGEVSLPRLRIRNWKVYQHYKDRNPPWIKLHFKLLSSKDWVTLADASRVLAIACMLLASESLDGSFDADPEHVRRVAYLNQMPDFTPLITVGFLEVLADASGCLQTVQNAEPETEKRQRREETDSETEAHLRPQLRAGTLNRKQSQLIEDFNQNKPKDPFELRIKSDELIGKLREVADRKVM
jgi:hypothetical protein